VKTRGKCSGVTVDNTWITGLVQYRIRIKCSNLEFRINRWHNTDFIEDPEIYNGDYDVDAIKI
jgi:hypothetical protein